MAIVTRLSQEESDAARQREQEEDRALRAYLNRTGAKSAEALVMGAVPTSDVDAD